MDTTTHADPAAAAAAAWAQISDAQKKAVTAAFDPNDTTPRAEQSIANAVELPDDQLIDVAVGPWDHGTGPDRQIVAACNEAIARNLVTDDLSAQIDRIRAWRQSAIGFLARPADTDQPFADFVTSARALYAPRAANLTNPTTDSEHGRSAAAELWNQASAANPSRSPVVMDAWLKHHLVFIHGRGTVYNRDKATAFNDELLRIRLVVTTWDK